jgi:hypothetical protein
MHQPVSGNDTSAGLITPPIGPTLRISGAPRGWLCNSCCFLLGSTDKLVDRLNIGDILETRDLRHTRPT